MIAGPICAAEFASARGETSTADFFLQHADWLAAHVEEWTITTAGELVEGMRRHCLRITILTGERGHYELAANHDAKPFITAMEKFANEGGMLSEQLWDVEDLPEKGMRRGRPTGAAMPLCWSHAEYLSLVRSAHDGVVFDRVEPAFQRYVVERVEHSHEMWSARHPIRRMPRGRILRLIVGADASIVWCSDGWSSTNQTAATAVGGVNLWFADLATQDCPEGALVEFTFFWREANRWEGRNYSVAVGRGG